MRGHRGRRVLKMLDKTGGVDHVKRLAFEGGPEEILADYVSPHSLQRQIGAQQRAAAKREIAAEDFVPEFPGQVGKEARAAGAQFEHLSASRTCRLAQQPDRLKIHVSIKPQPLRASLAPPVFLPIGGISKALHRSSAARHNADSCEI